MTHKSEDYLKTAIIYIILTISAIFLVYPFLWMIAGAFKDGVEVVKMPPTLLPSKLNFSNFIEIKKYFPIDRFMFNSIWISIVTSLMQMLFCTMGAFVFAKMDFKGKDTLFMFFLITLMIPLQVRVTPIFIIFSKLNLVDTYISLLLPGVFSAFGTFLMRQHIMTLPNSLLESAYMDGSSYTKVFFSIIIPLSKPALATLAIFTFMYSWNDYLWPLIIISSKEYMTLPLGLTKLTGRWSTEWNILMAGNVLSFIPILVVYIFAQQYFIKGLTMGSVKG